MTSESVLLTDVDDGIGIVTLNRPQARNALSHELRHALASCITAFEMDQLVDVIVLTATDPAFCAGLDLKELRTTTSTTPTPMSSTPKVRYRGPLPPHSKPIIGAINGAAITGGLELALACDFLVASELATFVDTHSKVGIQPGWGLTVLLPQAVGLRRAKEMSITGHAIDATTALSWGLVNHVVEHGALMEHALQIARHTVENDRKSVVRILQTYSEISGVSGGEGWDIEAAASKSFRLSANHK